MGTKLDAIRKKSKEGKDTFKDTDKISRKAVTDTKKMKTLLDSLPTDVDDEIIQAGKAVSEGTKTDAEKYMKSDVHTKLESGRKQMDAANKEASDQVKKNEQTQSIFSKMEAIGAFGKGARAEGATKIEKSTKDFTDMSTDNDAAAKSAKEAYDKDLSEISDMF